MRRNMDKTWERRKYVEGEDYGEKYGFRIDLLNPMLQECQNSQKSIKM
jgi:hypothetical protein